MTEESLFNRNGNKRYIGDSSGHIDVFNFNRCTRELKNFVNIKPSTFNPGVYNKERVYGISVSPDGSKVYASGWKRLIQYSIDTNTNQLLSQDTIRNNPYYSTYPYCDDNNCLQIGQHQLGPDDKIYITTNPFIFNLPSNNDTIQTYLSVINNPNVQGSACNFQPFSVSLLGRKAWACLPNNPNYNLGSLAESPCDTLTTSNEIKPNKSLIRVYPNPAKDVLNIEILNNLKPNSIALFTVSDTEVLSLIPTRSLTQLNINYLPQGVYLLRIVQADGTVQMRKVVVGNW